MKLPTILTTAATVAGFVPFGQAVRVCHDGEIALVHSRGWTSEVGLLANRTIRVHPILEAAEFRIRM